MTSFSKQAISKYQNLTDRWNAACKETDLGRQFVELTHIKHSATEVMLDIAHQSTNTISKIEEALVDFNSISEKAAKKIETLEKTMTVKDILTSEAAGQIMTPHSSDFAVLRKKVLTHAGSLKK